MFLDSIFFSELICPHDPLKKIQKDISSRKVLSTTCCDIQMISICRTGQN